MPRIKYRTCTLTDFPISIRLTSLALWQSNDCPSASKATLMNMDKYIMWIHYERLHNHNKAKDNKTVCIFFGIYCTAAYNFRLCFYAFLRPPHYPIFDTSLAIYMQRYILVLIYNNASHSLSPFALPSVSIKWHAIRIMSVSINFTLVAIRRWWKPCNKGRLMDGGDLVRKIQTLKCRSNASLGLNYYCARQLIITGCLVINTV